MLYLVVSSIVGLMLRPDILLTFNTQMEGRSYTTATSGGHKRGSDMIVEYTHVVCLEKEY